MKVKILRKGYIGSKIRKPGEIIDIPDDGARLGSWMIPVEEKDRIRLKDKLASFRTVAKMPAIPGSVPVTTGPGVPNALRSIPTKVTPPVVEGKPEGKKDDKKA